MNTIDLSKFINKNNTVTEECLDYVLQNSPFVVSNHNDNECKILYLPNNSVNIALAYIIENNGYVVEGCGYKDDQVKYLENLVNDVITKNNHIFTTNNLPKKSDFVISETNLIDNIKKSYINEYNKWMNSPDKPEYIKIDSNEYNALISDKQKIEIRNMFIDLGFSNENIDF